MILEQALRNVVPDEVEVIKEVELRRIRKEANKEMCEWILNNL